MALSVDTGGMSVPLPVVIVLASGRGERFRAAGGEGSKLQAMLGGQTVLSRTLAAVQASGLPWHLEDAGHPGMGDSIAAAVRATPAAGGWLVLPGDLPLVRPATLAAIAAALDGNVQAARPSCRGELGHPVAFARSCFTQLSTLDGHQGAAPVLRALADTGRIAIVDTDDIGTVIDIDTPDALRHAEALLAQGAREA